MGLLYTWTASTAPKDEDTSKFTTVPVLCVQYFYIFVKSTVSLVRSMTLDIALVNIPSFTSFRKVPSCVNIFCKVPCTALHKVYLKTQEI